MLKVLLGRRARQALKEISAFKVVKVRKARQAFKVRRVT